MALVARYILDGNTRDWAGANDGTPTNLTYAAARGTSVGAFDDTSPGTSIAVASFVSPAAATFAAWIKRSAQSANGYIVAVENPASGRRYNIAAVDDSLRVQDLAAGRDIGTPTDMTTWTHVAAVFSGREATLYYNGVSLGTVEYAGDPVLTSATLTLGGRTGTHSTGAWFDGNISDLRIYDHALTEAEVQKVMMSSPTPPLAHPGLVAEYRLDGNANDTSGGNRPGTPTNVTYAAGLGSQVGVFDGTAHVIPSTAFTAPFASGTWSVTAWAKIPHGAQADLFSGTASSSFFLSIVNRSGTGGRLRVVMGNEDSEIAAWEDTVFPDDEWFHFAFTCGVQGAVYINGQVAIAPANAPPVNYVDVVPAIGARNTAGSIDRQMTGSIARVRIYDFALSADDVQRDYRQGLLPLGRA